MGQISLRRIRAVYRVKGASRIARADLVTVLAQRKE